MKYIFVIFVILIAGLLGWPLLKEDTRDECVAAGSRAAGKMHSLVNDSFLEMTGRDVAEKEWREMPPQIACALVYWLGAPTVANALEEERRRHLETPAQDPQRAIRPEPPPAKPATKSPAQREMERELDLIQKTR